MPCKPSREFLIPTLLLFILGIAPPAGANVPEESIELPDPSKSMPTLEYHGTQLILDGTIPEPSAGTTVVKVIGFGVDGSRTPTRVVEADDDGRYTLSLDTSPLPDQALLLIVFWSEAGDLYRWVKILRTPGIEGGCTIEDMGNNQTVPRCACTDCDPRFTTAIYNASNEAQDSGVNVYDGTVVNSLPLISFDTRALDFSFEIFHQSLKVCDGEVGQSWSHTFNLAVVQTSPVGGFIQTPNLEALPFTALTYFSEVVRGWIVPEGFFSRLTRDDRHGRWRLTHYTGLEFEFAIGLIGRPSPLVTIREPNGNSMRILRDPSGFVSSVVTDLGQEIIFSYSGGGRLSSITDHVGRTWTFGFDEIGNLVTVTSPETEFADIAPGEEVIDTTLAAVTVTKGRTTTFSYDDPAFPHQITRVTDEREAVPLEYSYYQELPDRGRVATKTINGKDVSYIYDPPSGAIPPTLPVLEPGNRITRVVDRESNVTDYEMHGPEGGPLEGLGKFGLRREVDWTENGKGNLPLRDGEPLYWERRWLHDCDCLAPIQVSQPFRPNAPLIFDSFEMPINYPTEFFERNDRKQITAYTYAGVVRDPIILLPEIIQWEKTYDTFERFSRVLTYTEPRAFEDNPIYEGLDFTHSYIYDERGNRIRHDAPTVTRGVSGDQTIIESWTYNEFGQMTSHTDANGNIMTYTYFDGLSTGGDVNTKGEFGGYMSSMTVGAGGSIDTVADLTTTYRVNALGTVTRRTDPKGFVYDHEFNDLLEPTRDVEPEVTLRSGGQVHYETRYAYDGAGNRVMTRRSNVDVGGNVPANDFIDRSQRYDDVNNLLSSRVEFDATDANDLVTRYAYDGNDQLAIVQQPEGNRTFHLYDERLLRFKTFYGVAPPSSVVVPLEGLKNLTEGYPTDRRTESLGITSFIGLNIMTYDARRNETRMRDGRGNFIDNFYDFFNRRIATSDQNGHGKVTEYDDASNALTIQGGAVFKATGEILEILERIYQRYDEIGRRYQTVLDIDLSSLERTAADPDDGSNSSFLTVFDPGSRVLARIDANGNPTSYLFDAADRTASVTDALDNVRSYFYDANSNVVRMEEFELPGPGATGAPELYVTTYVYDELNRRTENHVLGLGGNSIDHETSYGYDSRTNTALVEDAEGNFALTTFDDFDRTVMTQRFDGDPLTSSPAELIHQEYAYDRNSRKTQDVARSDVSDSATDQITRYAYDDLDRLIRTVHPDSDDPINGSDNGSDGLYDRLEVDYDENSNTVLTREQRGVEFSSTYDPGDRLTRQDIALPPTVPGTTRQDYEYDSLDRLVMASNNYSLVKRDYDSLSRLTSEEQWIRLDGSGFSNDWENRVTIDFGYDRQSNRTTMSVLGPGGTGSLLDLLTEHNFDALNRMQGIEAEYFDRALDLIADYTYSGPTRVVRKTLGNNAALLRAYDVKRRVVSHRWLDLVGGSPQPLVGFEYDYDDVDNPLFEIFLHDLALADNYRHNDRYELTGVSYRNSVPVDYRTGAGSFATTFSYDDNYNRTEASFGDPFGNFLNTEDIYAINKANEYTQINRSRGMTATGTSPPLHDAAGNMTRLPVRPVSGGSSGLDVDAETTWDAFNLLFTASVPDGTLIGGAFLENYRYDPLGRRIAKFDISDDGCVACPQLTGRRYIYDKWSVIEERTFGADLASQVPFDIGDRLERVYVNGQQIDEPLLAAIDGDRDRDLDGGGVALNTPLGTDFEYYYLNNRMGSVMGLLDGADGRQTLEYYRYSSYGQPAVLPLVDNGLAPGSVAGDGLEDTPTQLMDNNLLASASNSEARNSYLFNARRFDDRSSSYYNRTRYYSAENGRFLGRDTVRDTAQYGQQYAYVANGPATHSDPMGTCQGTFCNSRVDIRTIGEDHELTNTENSIDPSSGSTFGSAGDLPLPSHSRTHCGGNSGLSCRAFGAACNALGGKTDCIPIQRPAVLGGGTNGESCNCLDTWFDRAWRDATRDSTDRPNGPLIMTEYQLTETRTLHPIPTFYDRSEIGICSDSWTIGGDVSYIFSACEICCARLNCGSSSCLCGLGSGCACLSLTASW